MMQFLTRITYATLTTATVLAVASSTSWAAGSGGSPNGKPFVAINDELVEVHGAVSSLQDQMDALVQQVDSIEERVGANEDAIAALEDTIDAIQVLIGQNTTDIESINTVILDLQAENDDLQGQINANIGDINTLQEQIDANGVLISSLQGAILLVQNGVVSLDADLQGQIDANNTLIEGLQNEITAINDHLNFKQDLVNGTCPGGDAISTVNPDGSVMCTSVGGGGGSGTLETLKVWSNFKIIGAGRTDFTEVAQCPSDANLTGVMFSGGNRVTFYHIDSFYSSPFGHYAVAKAYNSGPFNSETYVGVICMRIVP